MVNQTIHDLAKSNLFPIRAAHFFLTNDGQIDPQREDQLYEEWWSIKKVADLILIEARKCDQLIEPLLANTGIDLYELTTTDRQSISTIFAAIYPLLEEILLRGVQDTFYENIMDPQQRELLVQSLDELHAALNAPSELIGESGTHSRKARLLIQQAQRRADVSVELNRTEVIIDHTINQIANQPGDTQISRPLARHLSSSLIRDSEITTLAQKIRGLPPADQEEATIEFQKLLSSKAREALSSFSEHLPPAVATSPFTAQPTTPTSLFEPVAQQLTDHLFNLTGNDRDTVVSQTAEILAAPAVSSPLAQDRHTQRQVAASAIQTVIDQASGITGQPITIPDDQLTELTDHVSEVLSAPNQNTGRTIAQIVTDTLPLSLNTDQRRQVEVASTSQVNNLSTGQVLTGLVPGQPSVTPATIDVTTLQILGDQVTTSLATEHLPPAVATSPFTAQPTTPTSLFEPVAQQLTDHLFNLTGNDRDTVVSQTAEILAAPAVSSPLAQDRHTQRQVAASAIQTVIDQASGITGQPITIPDDQLTELTDHVSEVLSAPNQNTGRTIAQIVTDTLPLSLNTDQRRQVEVASTSQVNNLSTGQVLTGLVPGQPSVTPATIDVTTLQILGDQVTTSLATATRQATASSPISPNFTAAFITLDTATPSISQLAAITDQLATTITPQLISQQTASTIVQNYLLLLQSFEGTPSQNLSQFERENLAQIAVAAIGDTVSLSPAQTKAIVNILTAPPTPGQSAMAKLPGNIDIIHNLEISQPLSRLIQNLPQTTAVPVSATPEIDNVRTIRQQLLDAASRTLRGNELTAARHEINFLFSSNTAQPLANLIARYQNTPPPNRPPITTIQIFTIRKRRTGITVNQPSTNPMLQSSPITTWLRRIPSTQSNPNFMFDIVRFLDRHGTNSRLSQLVRRGIVRTQASSLLYQGLNEEDLLRTRDRLVQRGPRANAGAIREIDSIRQEMTNIRTSNPLVNRYLNFLHRRREIQLRSNTAEPIKINYSPFNTVIQERNLYDPRARQIMVDRLLRRVFGEGNVIVRGRVMRVNRLAYYQFRINRAFYGNISRFRLGRNVLRFSRNLREQGLSRIIRARLEPLGQAAVKRLAGTAAGRAAGQAAARFAASAIGKALTKVLASTLVKLGITALAGVATGGIGFIVSAVIEIGKKAIGTIMKGIKKAGKAFMQFSQQMVDGALRSEDKPIFKDKRILLLIGIGCLIFFLTIVPVIFLGTIAGSFQQAKSFVAGYFSPPQPAQGCFQFWGPWSDTEKALENQAITELMKFPKYYNKICPAGKKITLYRDPSKSWCVVWSSSLISITNACLGTPDVTLYSLAHETGHIYAWSAPSIYSLYVQAIGPLYKKNENFICSYPLAKVYGEDFPETIAVYIMNQVNPNFVFPGGCKKTINLKVEYPIHYNFAKSNIF